MTCVICVGAVVSNLRLSNCCGAPASSTPGRVETTVAEKQPVLKAHRTDKAGNVTELDDPQSTDYRLKALTGKGCRTEPLPARVVMLG